MKIGLHDAELDYMPNKSFPNLAIMKISSHHKSLGDTVEWWQPLDTYDIVYSSKVFDFTPENPYLPPNTIKGGTGYGLYENLLSTIDNCYPDYSIYLKCDYAVGFITRGCIRNCRWCVVPKKEGEIHNYSKWQDIIRQDTNKLVLMDNNILASSYGISQLDELSNTNYKIDLNQGMDARLVTNDIAKILAKLHWIKYIRFSCDTIQQIDSIINTANLLINHGVKPWRLFIYLLVTSDIDNASYRIERLKQLKGITIYAQAERNERLGIVPNQEQLEFAQRYVYSGKFRTETWQEYCQRLKNDRKRFYNE